MIHTVRGISVINETDVFLKFSGSLYDPVDTGSLISGSSVLSKCSLYIWKLSGHVLSKPRLENFKHYLLACEMSAIVQ